MEQEESPEEQPTERVELPPTIAESGVLPSQGGRNVTRAIITGVALAALAVGLLYIHALAFFVLALVVLLIAQGEYYHAARQAGHDPATALGLVAGAVMLVGVLERGEAAAGIVMFLMLVFSLVWFMAAEQRGSIVTDISVTVLGVAYVPLLGSFAALMLVRPDGRGVLLTTLLAAAVYDIAAYAGGSRFGKTPLAPTISPKKTREGALLGTAGAIVVGLPFAVLLGPWSWWQAVVLCLLISIAAPIGDLVESMIKRDFGIKDMGTIFPGHGGALDRVDAILFAAPVSYLTLKIFGL